MRMHESLINMFVHIFETVCKWKMFYFKKPFCNMPDSGMRLKTAS